MILRELEIENWGPLVARRKLEFVGPGLNVIHGPNESGKSTLMRAIGLGLFNDPSSGNVEAKSLALPNIEGSPNIILRVEHGGRRYEIDKVFKPTAGTTRLVSSAGGERREQTGEGAQAALRELFGIGEPSSSPNRLDWRRQWNLLWVRQGQQAALPASKDPGLETLKQALAAQAGDVLTSDLVRATLAALETQVGKAFTPGATWVDRKRSINAPSRQAADELKRADEQLTTLRARRAQVADLLDQLPGQRAAVEQRAATERETQSRLIQARADAENSAAAVGQAEQYRVRTDQAIAGLAAAEAAQHQRVEARAALAAAQQRWEQSCAERDQLRAEQKRQQAQREPLLAAQRAAKEAAKNADNARQTAQLDVNWREAHAKCAELAKVLADAAGLRARCVDLAVRVQALEPFDGAPLRRLEELAAAVEAAGVAVRTASSRVTVTALRGLTVTAGDESVELASQGAHEWHVGQPTTFRLDDLAELTIAPGGAELGQLQVAAAQAAEELRRALAELGVATLAEARERHQELIAARHEAGAAGAQLAVILPNGPDATQAELEQQQVMLERYGARLSAAQCEALAAQSLAELNDRLHEARLAAERTAQDETRCDVELAAYDQVQHDLPARLAAAEQAANEAQGRLQVLTDQLGAAVAQAADEQLAAAVDAARAALVAAVEAWRQALLQAGYPVSALPSAEELGAFADQLSATAQRAAGALRAADDAAQRATEQVQAAKQKLAELNGQLSGAQSGGSDQELEGAERRVAEIRERHERLQREELGLLYLRHRLQAAKGETERAARQPLSAVLDQLVPLWQPQAEVVFGEDLGVESVARGGHLAAVDLLSGGAQAQLNLLVRLAMAQVLGKDQPVFLLLDEVLETTDDARFESMIAVLREVARSQQIIIFSWDVDRYTHLGADCYLDLTQVIAQ